jgi:electron transfer flavoprotein beta subunit
MKIVVCVKQVPEVTNVQVDPGTGTLIREGVQAILNPFCEYALDQALRLAATRPDVEIIALSMGPQQAKEALYRCLELGADSAILVSDRKFAGADTWATSLTLAETIRKFVPDFDLVLMGKQAIDGDTAQVGPEVAEILAVPQITYGVELTLNQTGKRIQVKRELEDGEETMETSLPALVTVSKGESVRRIASLQGLLNGRSQEIHTVTAADLDLNEDQLGLAGSFTQVVKVFPPQSRKQGQKVDGSDADKAARAIVDYLVEQGFVNKDGGNE